MNNEPCLIILIPGFPEDEDDSTCLPSQQALIKSVNKLFPNIKLVIISFQYPYKKTEYKWHGVPIYSLGGSNRGGLARRILWYKAARKLTALKDQNNVLGVLSFWAGECALVGQRWSRRHGIRHISWSMGQDAKKENYYLKKILPKSEDLVALSDFNATELLRNHGLKSAHTIPLGIDPDSFPKVLLTRDIDILCAGSLIPLKQFRLCIGIMQEIKTVYPNARMMICGNGPCEKDLSSRITDMGLEENIRLEGEIKHLDLLKLMTRSKIFLHPSSYEGFGQVCLEARAAGTPVVSFTKPMKENIPGWHIVRSTEEMAKMCIELLASKIDHFPIYPYTSDDAARTLMGVFAVS